MHLTITPRFLPAAFAAVAFTAACADDPNVPAAGVAGAYHATMFAVASGGPALDLLALGATLTMTLDADHTTTGRLFVPAAVAGDEPLDESLSGSWRQSNDTVYFAGSADTFVRDVPFVIRGATLHATEATPNGVIQVTLSK